jgi:hypothetical protein
MKNAQSKEVVLNELRKLRLFFKPVSWSLLGYKRTRIKAENRK